MTTNTTRRSLLRLGTGALYLTAGAAVVAGGIALPDEAKGAQIARPDSATWREWRRLLGAYRDARVKEVQALEDLDSCECRWNAAAKEPKPEEPSQGPLDTTLSLDAIVAQSRTPEWKAQWAAHEARVADWQARRDRDRHALIGDAEQRYAAAESATTEAFLKVKAYPVTSLPMLNEKAAAFVERYSGELEGDDALALIADIQRLSSGEA